MRRRALSIVAIGAVLAAVGSPATPVRATAPAIPSDFNGDGYADLAIGVSGENVGPIVDAGAVNVLYGSATGLGSAGNQLWTQDSPGVVGVSQRGDRFGATLAFGDFDRDGFSDLAIDAPGDPAGGVAHAGTVTILYGSRSGLRATRDQRWSRTMIPGVPPASRSLGSALVGGDFNGDGYDDLAIGNPSGDGAAASETVHLLYGGPGGLHAAGAKVLTRSMTGRPPTVPAPRFGSALAAGDLNGDGYDDLAVGAPGGGGPGDVAVFYGSAVGLGGRVEAWDDARAGVAAIATSGEQFGSAIAIGDLNHDGYGDVAVEASSVSVCDGGGAICWPEADVTTIDGSAAGLVPGLGRVLHLSLGGSGAGGGGLVACDVGGDFAADLAAGDIRAWVGNRQAAGSVFVFFGSATPGAPLQYQQWTEDTPHVPGVAATGDRFGYALACGNYGRTSRADLAIGIPFADIGTHVDAGRVDVLYGQSSGPSVVGVQSWTQNAAGILDMAESGDELGISLAH